MANEIAVSNLTIQLTNSTKQATSAINDESNALRKLKTDSKKAADSQKDLKDKTKNAADAAKRGTGAFTKLLSSIQRIAFYRAIRAGLKAVTASIREGINNLVLYSQALNGVDSSRANWTMSEFATTALYVKNSLGAALMPLLNMLVPVVNAIADAFIAAANAVNQFFHAFRGDERFTKAKRYTVDYAESLDRASGAAKELKKQVFGFDELNIFNSPSAGGGGGAPEMDYSKMFEEAKVGMNFDALGDTIKQKLAGIATIVSAATLAVGAILALSGVNIPLGIGLMAAGATGLVAAAINWNTGDTAVRQAIARIVAALGAGLLALGAILTFSGANVPLGIGMMAAGAVALATAATINWDFLGNTVDEKMGAIVGIVSGMLLALGAILVFVPSMQGIGIGLLAAGAIGLATSLEMNETLREIVTKKFEEIGGKISIALLALGAILALVPLARPLGIGLIAAGAIGLAKSMSMNDQLKKEVHEKFQEIERILGLSLAGLGAVLLFCMPALGIPLLITGLGLVGASIDWDALNKKISEKWEELKQKGAQIKADIKAFVDSIVQYFKDLFNLNASLKVDTQTTGVNAFGYERRASGGFVETGTYFLAGEAGPELVGTVGGQTHVTNQDQFTAGMEDIMDNTNTVILQAAQSLIQAIQSKDFTSVVQIGDRQIVSAYDRGKKLAGASLVE